MTTRPANENPFRILNLRDISNHILDNGVQVVGSEAIGHGLHTNGHLGADMIHVPQATGFPVHTHPGDHLLLSIGGEGSITVDRENYLVKPGDLYMIDGNVPHSVGASPDSHHLLMAIGAPHKSVDSRDRMTFTDWEGHVLHQPLFHDTVGNRENETQ